MSKAHRLAAIMFTDIRGYTKLMQKDEDQAVEIRKRHREIFQSATERNDGKIIQYYGDGTLSIFESCVDAVRCGKEMQNQFQSDPVVPVRVGIHLGDILLSEEDIIGDSVNVASRVESLGVAGSVLISNKVYEEIKNKKEFQVKKLGKFHFKNDSEPRTIYAVLGEKLIIPKKKDLQGKLEPEQGFKHVRIGFSLIALAAILSLVIWGVKMSKRATDHSVESLAVLPLYDRIGLSEDEDYIIEGLHEELITKLLKSGLNVKPFSIMKSYRNSSKSLEEIGRELNVDGLMEGSLFRTDSVYRIRVQIINISSQEYIDEPYEAQAEFANVMSIFSELVEAIANQIKYVLSEETQTYLSQNRKVDPEAYNLYLKGRYFSNEGSSDAIRKAIDYYNQALELDSTFVDCHVSLVESYLLQGFSSVSPSEELDKFRYHLSLGIDQDPFFAKDHHMMAMVKVFDNWDWTGADEELKKAMKESPESWEPYDSYCQLMWAVGDMKKSIAAGEKAVKINPDAHFARCDLAWAYYFNEQKEKAQVELDNLQEKFPNCPHHNGLAILMEIDKKTRIGQSLVTTIDKIERKIDTIGNPVFNLSLLGYAHALDGNREKALEILEIIESNKILGADKIYIALGDHDKAIELLDNAISNRSFFQMYAIKVMPWYDPLRDDPRFENILTRMGLGDHQLN